MNGRVLLTIFGPEPPGFKPNGDLKFFIVSGFQRIVRFIFLKGQESPTQTCCLVWF